MHRYLHIFLAIIFNIIGQISLKYSMLHFKGITEQGISVAKLLKMFFAPFSLLGIGFYGLSAVFWMLGLTKVELSVAYPMLSLGYVLVFFLSIFLFNEPFKLVRLLGVFVIILGVYLISR